MLIVSHTSHSLQFWLTVRAGGDAYITIATTYHLNGTSVKVQDISFRVNIYIFTWKVFSSSKRFSFYCTIPYSPLPYDALRVYAFSKNSLYQTIH